MTYNSVVFFVFLMREKYHVIVLCWMSVCWSYFVQWVQGFVNLGRVSIALVVWVLASTLCLKKKFPPLNYLQLCQILTDVQNFCTAGKHMKFATKPCDNTHHTLGMLVHYLGKLKIQFFCRYSLSRHCRNANILHFNGL